MGNRSVQVSLGWGILILAALSVGACQLPVGSSQRGRSSPITRDGGGGSAPVEPAVLQYVAKSVADHGVEFQLGLDIADSSFVESRKTSFVRLSLSEAIDPSSATDLSVTVLSNGTVSVGSTTEVVSLSGNDLDIRHSEFFGETNKNARLCIVIDGLKRADGALYPREVIKFSRLIADVNGDGVVTSGDGNPDFLAVQQNMFHEIGDSSVATQIRADLNTDGVIEIADYALYISHRNETLPSSWPAGCD